MTIRYSDTAPSAADYHTLFATTGWNRTYCVTVDDCEQILVNSWRTISAYDKDALVGFGRLLCDGVMHAVIFDLIVHPDHQREGIGSAILRRLVVECESAGIRDIQLFSANGKTGFYIKHGFAPRPPGAPGMEIRRAAPAQGKGDSREGIS